MDAERGQLMPLGGLRIGGEVASLVGVAAVLLAVALAAAIPLIRDRPVPAGLLGAGLGGLATAIALAGWVARPAAGMDLDAARHALDTTGAMWILAPVLVGAIAGLQAVILAIPVVRAKRRAWGLALGVLAAGWIAAGLEAAGGALIHNGLFAGVRAAAIAVAALVAAGLALGGQERDGADGASAAAVNLVLLVASVQRMLPGVGAILVQKPLLSVVPQARAAGAVRFLEPLVAEQPWQWAALGAVGLAAIGVAAVAGLVRPTAWTALPWLAAAVLLALSGLRASDLDILVAASLR